MKLKCDIRIQNNCQSKIIIFLLLNSLISGVTLHAFAGINGNDLKLPANVVVEKIKNSKVKFDNWKKCKYLIIDEISMIDGDFFDYLNEIAK